MCVCMRVLAWAHEGRIATAADGQSWCSCACESAANEVGRCSGAAWRRVVVTMLESIVL